MCGPMPIYRLLKIPGIRNLSRIILVIIKIIGICLRLFLFFCFRLVNRINKLLRIFCVKNNIILNFVLDKNN